MNQPCEDLDESGLTRAVFADQRDDLAGTDREIDVIQRNDARESLSDAIEFEDRIWHSTV